MTLHSHPSKKRMVEGIRDMFWALRNEPERVWAWMHRHDPFTKKRYTFRNAVRAVVENPPSLDISWDEDMEAHD